jgi:hypothetical protein
VDAVQEENIVSQAVNWTALWKIDCQVVACEHCNNAYLVSVDASTLRCPTCQRDDLDPIEAGADQMAYSQPPELVLGYTVDETNALQRIIRYTGEIPLRPRDIQPKNLRERLRRVYLPMWLVDGDIQATWQAEAGYFYEVVSHREQLASGQWQSREVKKRRTRWEPRVGRLTRHYDNVVAPALERFGRIRQVLGDSDISKSAAYTPEAVQSAFVCLPDRSPDDAWIEALKGFKSAAAEECRKAAGADDIREYHWSPEVEKRNWTQLLLPFYSTYYLDDDGEQRMIYVNGQTGQVWGHRQTSLRRAQTAALIAAGVALLFFVLSLLSFLLAIAVPPVVALGVIGLLAAAIFGIVGLVRLIHASQFNKKHQGDLGFTL